MLFVHLTHAACHHKAKDLTSLSRSATIKKFIYGFAWIILELFLSEITHQTWCCHVQPW